MSMETELVSIRRQAGIENKALLSSLVLLSLGISKWYKTVVVCCLKEKAGLKRKEKDQKISFLNLTVMSVLLKFLEKIFSFSVLIRKPVAGLKMYIDLVHEMSKVVMISLLLFHFYAALIVGGM